MEAATPAVRGELAGRIQAAALELFAVRGYGVSLQEIAVSAGTTKANVLYHFGSKEQLAAAVLEPVIASVQEIRRRLNSEDQFDVALAAADLMLGNRLAVRLLVFHHQSLPDPSYADRFLEVITRLSARLDPVDPTAPTRCLIGLVGIAYVLVLEPNSAQQMQVRAQLDDRYEIAALIRDLTRAPVASGTPPVPASSRAALAESAENTEHLPASLNS